MKLSEWLKDKFSNNKHQLVIESHQTTVGYSEYTCWYETVVDVGLKMSEEEYEDLMKRIEEFEEYWKKKKET